MKCRGAQKCGWVLMVPTVVKNRFDSCSVCALLYYSQNTICSTFIPVTTSKKLLIWMFVDQSSLIWPFNPTFTQCLIFVWSSVFSLNQCEPNIFVIHSNSPQCDTSYVFICLSINCPQFDHTMILAVPNYSVGICGRVGELSEVLLEV